MTETAPLITILEDTAEIRAILSDALQAAGFRTMSFGNSQDFERALRNLSPDLCLIDLGLPDRDGLAIVNKLAIEQGTSVIIISGRNMLQDKILGLEMGADDYITKPFEPTEVVARVRAQLRKSKPMGTPEKTVAHFNGWSVDFENFTLSDSAGQVANLSNAECQLMQVFLKAPNRLITREQIIEALETPGNDNFDRAVDVRVSRLRTKLKDDPNNPTIIKTVYGAGYIFIGTVEP